METQEMNKEVFACTDNWAISNDNAVLDRIHEDTLNIVIHERDTTAFAKEIASLQQQDVACKASGTIPEILEELSRSIDAKVYSLLFADINRQLSCFKEIVRGKKFRLLLATVNTNMCRKFHTDVNDVRLLCTYSGPGTLWLTDDNINKKALRSFDDNVSIVLDEAKIQQVATGAIVLLKGAMYPQYQVNAAVHRSPTIEETGERRLLLRIDTNDGGIFM